MTSLEKLVQEIERLEAIISEWDESQQDVTLRLKIALTSLHNHALVHVKENIKPESISSLMITGIDNMVYKLLLDKKIIKVPKEPLFQRLQQVIDKIRPYLKYNENLELVAFKPPNTLEISLVVNADNDTSVKLKLLPKIKKTIQYYCPEITKIIAVNQNYSNLNFNQ